MTDFTYYGMTPGLNNMERMEEFGKLNTTSGEIVTAIWWLAINEGGDPDVLVCGMEDTHDRILDMAWCTVEHDETNATSLIWCGDLIYPPSSTEH